MILQGAGFAVRPGEHGNLLVDAGDPAEIAALLVREGQALSHLTRHRPSLEGIYHRHIAQAA
jgi:ABC-2 type transport system ATP-binding protein